MFRTDFPITKSSIRVVKEMLIIVHFFVFNFGSLSIIQENNMLKK